jgi:hypothetical protein
MRLKGENMSYQLEFNFTYWHTPAPRKPAIIVDSHSELFSDPRHIMTPDRRLIASNQDIPSSRKDTSLQFTATRAYLCVRRARRGRNYVAVQVVPAGVKPLSILNRARAEKNGIKIVYAGEGYRERDGPHSSFSRAIAAAEAYIAASGLVDAGEF